MPLLCRTEEGVRGGQLHPGPLIPTLQLMQPTTFHNLPLPTHFPTLSPRTAHSTAHVTQVALQKVRKRATHRQVIELL